RSLRSALADRSAGGGARSGPRSPRWRVAGDNFCALPQHARVRVRGDRSHRRRAAGTYPDRAQWRMLPECAAGGINRGRLVARIRRLPALLGAARRWRNRARAGDRRRCEVKKIRRGGSMCLGVPGKVLTVDGSVATVDFFGVRRDVRLDIVDEPVEPGDYVMNHVGFAIRRIPPAEVKETLALYEQLLAAISSEDLLAADIRGEIAGTREKK